MKKGLFLFLLSVSMLITSCAIEDEAQCITTLDCAAGMICVDGFCVEDQGGTPDNSAITDNFTQPDDNQDYSDQSDMSNDLSDQSDESEVSDETVDEVADETVDTADDSDQSDQSDDLSDDLSDQSDDQSDQSDESEMSDETPDEDTAEPLTCATAGLTCGSNSHCDDSSGTPKCVCDTNYQDEDNNGTCLVSCNLWDCNESASNAFNKCTIDNGVATCHCDPFEGYQGTHCEQCSYGYHEGGFGYEDECYEDTCSEAEDPWHGWLDCWPDDCVDGVFGAECDYF